MGPTAARIGGISFPENVVSRFDFFDLGGIAEDPEFSFKFETFYFDSWVEV